MIDDNKAQERGRGRPRRGEGHDRESLLDAALTCFAENGFENTSLRSIAARAGVDVALISYHYGSKLGLWSEVVASVGDDSANRIRAFLKECEGLENSEKLGQLTMRMVEMISERPQFAQLMVGEMIAAEDETRNLVVEKRLVAPMLALLLPFLASIPTDSREPALDGVLRLLAALSMAGLVVSTRPFLGRLTSLARRDGDFRNTVGALMARLLKA